MLQIILKIGAGKHLKSRDESTESFLVSVVILYCHDTPPPGWKKRKEAYKSTMAFHKDSITNLLELLDLKPDLRPLENFTDIIDYLGRNDKRIFL